MKENKANSKDPQLVHAVYFALNNASAEEKQRLVKECYEYLKEHPGVEYFAAGPRDESLNRPVNAVDYDVCLLVVFANRQAHDIYATNARHLEFIERNKAGWKQIRVYDSLVK